MSYSYAQVSHFADLISTRLGRKMTSYEYHHWYEVEAKLKVWADALKTATTRASQYIALNEYCTAVAYAKAYLVKKDKQSIFSKCFDSDERNKYLDQCVDWALFYFNRYKKDAPDFWQGIIAPTQEAAIIRRVQSTGPGLFDKLVNKMIRDDSVDHFVASPQFKRLKAYHTHNLVNDLRDHSFLGLNLRVEKAPILKGLLNRLEAAQTMKEIQQIFDDFYSHKNNDYCILNMGQNITTRILNVLGIRSTTVYLIDELYETLCPSNLIVKR